MDKYRRTACFLSLRSISKNRLSISSAVCRLGCFLLLSAGSAVASTAGLPFTEDFSSQALMDSSQTTANWSTAEKSVALAWRAQRLHQLPNSAQTGIGIGSDDDITYALILGDVDGDGDLDVLSGNKGQTNILAFNDGTVFFNSTVSIGSDSDDTRSLALGDVDGDGDLDVIAGNNNQTNKLYLNNGVNSDGTFKGFTSGVAISSDTDFTRSITLGDVDGDGDLDALTGNYQQSNKLYLNDGSGGFVSGASFGNDTGTTSSIIFGDVDSDGDMDVLAGNEGQINKLYLNNGVDSDGTFGGFSSGMDIGSETDSTFSLTLGDVDSDGDLDVLTGNFEQPNKLYLNNGNGGFADGVAFSSDEDKTYSVALGDVDRDGDLDLLEGNNGQANRLYLNDGNGAYTNGVAIGSEDDSSRSIALADVDGDGGLDMLAGNSNTANKLYLNDNSSGFANGINIGLLSNTNAITLGDVDNDGDLDVLAGNELLGSGDGGGATNKLFINDGSGGFALGVDISSDADITISLTLGDLDGDGYLDLVVADTGEFVSHKVHLNNGVDSDGTFKGFANGVPFSSDGKTTAITLGDVDNDGDLDVLAANSLAANKLYLNDGSGDFGMDSGLPIYSDNASFDTRSLVLGDMNGDGYLDLLAGNYEQTNYLYLNDGNGGFGGYTAIGSDEDSTTSLIIGDVDGDGDLDVLVGNYGQTNKLYRNDGSRSFRGLNLGTDTDFTNSLALGDVDGDGGVDLLAGNYGQTNKLYLFDGSGAIPFEVEGVAISSSKNTTSSVALGDVDGDGDLDLFTANYDQINGGKQYNTLYLNNSPGGFAATGKDIGSATDNTRSLAIGDVDGDGDLDVLSGNYRETNKWYLNDGNGSFASGVAISSEQNKTLSLTLADVDGDGNLDVLAGNDLQTNTLYLNSGVDSDGAFKGFEIGLPIGSDTDTTKALMLGDVDGDGNLDVLAGNGGRTPDGETSKLYLSNGVDSDGTFRGFENGVPINRVLDNTSSLALGDVDGDGDLDVLLGNYVGTNKLYLNDGTGVFVTNGSIGSHTDITFELILGDVDGDGDLDVIAGNEQSSHKLYINDGNGSFNFVAPIGDDFNRSTSLTLGDVDGDGDLDVLVIDRVLTNKLYLNDGSGGFATGFYIGSDTDNITFSLALADMDGDGDLDLLTGNDEQTNKLYRFESFMTHSGRVVSSKINVTETDLLSVRLDATQTSNTASARNTDIDYYLSNNGGKQWHQVKSGKAFTFTSAGTDDLRWKAQLQSLSPTRTPLLSEIAIKQIIDTDDDGSPDECDAICIASGGVADTDDDNDGVLDLDDAFPLISFGELSDTDNDGAPNECDDACQTLGMSADEDDDNDGVADVDDAFPLISIAADKDGTLVLILGDVDGDGDLDVLAGNDGETNKLYLNDGSGGYREMLVIGSETARTFSLALIDVDGDNYLDVVAGDSGQTNKLYMNEGLDSDGTFKGFASGVAIGDETDFTRAVTLGDMDGDGDLDVLAGNVFSANKLYLNGGVDSDGSFRGFTSGVGFGNDTDWTRALALGDVDGDGDLDFVAGNLGATNKLYLNDGSGDFASGVAIGSDTDETYVVVLVDVDGDTHLDVLAGNLGQTNKLYLNDGDGNFASGVNIASDADNTSSLVLGDMDADGDLDVLAGNFGQINKLYLNDGSGGFEDPLDIGIASDADNTSSLVLGDMDADGDLDVLAGNYGQTNKLYLNDGSGGFSESGIVIDEFKDTDNDGAPNECDTACQTLGMSADEDDDNDGVADADDAFSLISIGDLTDTDNDGAPDECDVTCQALGLSADDDDDNDGVADADDAFSLISIGDLTDTDNDGAPNECDATCQTTGMSADDDDDNDGVVDSQDAFSLISIGELTDTDNDGAPDECDAACQTSGMSADDDDDNDGIADTEDAFSLISIGELTDTDGDGAPDECDVTCQTSGMSADDDDDNDGVVDSQDAFSLIAIGGFLDTDSDGIPNECDAACISFGMTADADDDNDGLPDAYELANGLDPLDASDGVLDTDGDGLSNYDEFRIGTDINLADTDDDRINDNIDNNPLVVDEEAPTLYSGQLTVLPDMTDDGIAELGILKVLREAGQVVLEVLNGQDQSLLNTLTWADSFEDSSLTLHVIPDMNDNGFAEVGLFGIQDSTNNEGKPQMFVRDLQTGNRVNVYNWPANWKEVSAMLLTDISGDGIAEIGMQGRFKDAKRPQLVVKVGNTNTIMAPYSYPDLFVSPQYYQHSDINGDGFAEIVIFGRLSKNNKIQAKIASGQDAGNKMKAYNFPDKWDNVSWHRLDDSNGDGQDDWGMFGTLREDGRPQLVNKNGVSPVGNLRIFSWPGAMQNAQFFRIPDMNNDGVDEVAAAGRRSDNGRYQFQVQDGTDRNELEANHNLNLSLTDVTYHVLPDLSGDEKAEIGFMGINPDGDYELVIRHGNTADGEYASYNLGNDWQNAPTITSLGDTDDDGSPDLLIYGQNAGGEQLVITDM